MLIRRPVEEVFNAFVDPTVTTRFWFSRSSGQLAPPPPLDFLGHALAGS
jgi:hypothetical protein